MANHPLNLALRFLLEITALISIGYWGWTQHSGLMRILFTLGLPIFAAAIWGIFRVPGFPGDAPIAVPGIVRLLVEAAVLGSATWALYAADRPNWALIFGGVVLFHYGASYDYVIELLRL
jgi:hypothetical protein